MKKLYSIRQPEEARSCLCAFQTITNCRQSVDSGTKKYMIFYIADEQYPRLPLESEAPLSETALNLLYDSKLIFSLLLWAFR
jgi:hypothetical protein